MAGQTGRPGRPGGSLTYLRSGAAGAGAPEDKVALTVDERNAAEKKRNEQMAEAMAAAQDVGFMTKFSAKLMPENVPFPWLDGREWVEDLVPRCGTDPRRFDLAG